MKMLMTIRELRAMSRELVPWTIAGFLAGVLMSRSLSPAAQLPSAPAGIAPQTHSVRRVFHTRAGLMLKFVRPEKVADFEGTLTRLKEALDRTRDPLRKQQAGGWRIFRAAETSTSGDVVYVFEIDPAVRNADYAISTILAEAFPSEAQGLYRRYAESYAAEQNVINLSLIAALGEPSK